MHGVKEERCLNFLATPYSCTLVKNKVILRFCPLLSNVVKSCIITLWLKAEAQKLSLKVNSIWNRYMVIEL